MALAGSRRIAIFVPPSDTRQTPDTQMARRRNIEDIKKLLIKKHSRPPQFVSEQDFSDYIDHTVIARFREAEKAAAELKSMLQTMRGTVDKRGADMLRASISKLDEIISGPKHGLLYYNRTFPDATAEGDPIQLVWEDRRNAPRRGKRQSNQGK
jgi:hypothetical protein